VTTVLIVAPTAVARVKLAAVVGASKTLHPVVGAADLSLPEQIEAAQYDVLLVDLGSARTAAWLRNLGAEPLPPAIVLLTEDARRTLGVEALRAGVRAVLPRRASGEEIIAAIEAAATGLIVIHPDTVGALQPVPSAGRRAPHAARDRGTRPDRRGARQQNHRRSARYVGTHRQVPHRLDLREAQRWKPYRGGHHRRSARVDYDLSASIEAIEATSPRSVPCLIGPDARKESNQTGRDARKDQGPVRTP